ncbi:nostrin-like isoform X2 [Limulus polyphemus]|nr:nostrin-like isoform X2 [Limulus polyphemus]XP_022239852.1 nostrin-like isoform X2 [Limulus polyphemus]
MKQGEDFCKEIASVMNERCELEYHYAKNLGKLASKVAKASKEAFGTTAQTWLGVAVAMEHEAELHKYLSSGFQEDVVKPLKVSIESQHKTRKQVELMVDRTSKSLADFRNEEMKSQKLCFICTKENERMKDQKLESRSSKGKIITDKDISKLEAKRRKAEETMVKADYDYYNNCIKAERMRQEWESAVFQACTQFQEMEEEKLAHMQDFVQKYANHLSVLGPKMVQDCDKLSEVVSKLDVEGDIQCEIKSRRTGPNCPEQLLPDFYAEDMSNLMNKVRRKESLQKFYNMLKRDVELERKGKEGVEHLARVFHETPNFGNADAQQEVTEKLYHLRAMLAFLEASLHKVECALADLDDNSKPTHPLTAHIDQYRDKQGVIHSVLKLPDVGRTQLFSNDWSENADLAEIDRGAGDGTSLPPSDCDEAAFNHVSEIYVNIQTLQLTDSEPVGVCQALYSYQAKLEDELTIFTGDIIKIIMKCDTNWWKGELNGKIGLFPSSYVEEL